MTALQHTDLPLAGRRAGKVRDIYDLPGDPPRLLIVATDRISAFDVVLPTPIPGKGELLTRMAGAWMEWAESACGCCTHRTGVPLAEASSGLPEGVIAAVAPRSEVVLAAEVIPIECVVRGYLEGSGWADYQRTGAVCGISLPEGLRQCDRLPEPLFTPATKALAGDHDENISYEDACERVGVPLMKRLRDLSLELYTAAAERARERGIIIADTKFEFGMIPRLGADPVLVDEALTPDSSRFWPADRYEPGHAQPSYDKQFVREYLEGLVSRGAWDKTAPGPELPAEIVSATLSRYREAYERLFGASCVQ